MKFGNYIGAINFVLIKCALMKIDVTTIIPSEIGVRTYYLITDNERVNKQPHKPTQINIKIKENFDAKYIVMLNTILKEHFDIYINRVTINTEENEPSEDDLDLLYTNDISYTLY